MLHHTVNSQRVSPDKKASLSIKTQLFDISNRTQIEIPNKILIKI